MKLIRRPWIWAVRFRHRRGYGVHSPFAFAFIKGVLFEQTAYYAYAPLALLHPWWVRWGRLYPMQCRRLLFRLANYVHPTTLNIIGCGATETTYITTAVPNARQVDGAADFVFIGNTHLETAQALLPQMPPDGMMVLEGIHRNAITRQQWKSIQRSAHTGITFDLYDYGIAFFNHHLYKQHYIINF